MLNIEYEQSLIETTVFLAVRNDERLECELHLVIDRLYEIPDEEIRQREFVPVFREFFTKLGFDKLMTGLLCERPSISELIDRCIVREAPRKKAQSAELLIQEKIDADSCTTNTLIIQVCPQSFLETHGTSAIDSPRVPLVNLMRRELLHVADMLDNQFGYVRQSFAGDPSKQNLQRDRYRILWDTYVEGRLEREKFGVDGKKKKLAQAFGRVFSTDNDHVFDSIFDAPSLNHGNLMDWVHEPDLLRNLCQVSSQHAASKVCV